MAFNCTAGHRVSTDAYPSENEYTLVSDAAAERAIREVGRHLEGFCRSFANGMGPAQSWIREMWAIEVVDDDSEKVMATVANELITRLVLENEPSVLRCPECGRLYVQRRAFENTYDGYLPE